MVTVNWSPPPLNHSPHPHTPHHLHHHLLHCSNGGHCITITTYSSYDVYHIVKTFCKQFALSYNNLKPLWNNLNCYSVGGQYQLQCITINGSLLWRCQCLNIAQPYLLANKCHYNYLLGPVSKECVAENWNTTQPDHIYSNICQSWTVLARNMQHVL